MSADQQNSMAEWEDALGCEDGRPQKSLATPGAALD